MTVASSLTRQELNLLFQCPLSHCRLEHPVLDPCGHTFEEPHIRHHLSTQASCPLSNQPLQADQLLANRMVKLALDVLAQQPSLVQGQAGETVSFNSLDDEEREQLTVAIEALRAQKALDAAKNIPAKTAQPVTAPKGSNGCYKCYKC